jgi:ferritin-like metal-binding protein YciE
MATEKAVRFIKSHLEDAIAAEKSFETQLRGFASEGSSDQIHSLFLQHANETRAQYERLTRRLTELAGEPSEAKSFLAHLVGLSPKLAQLGHDTVDRVTQNLMLAYAVEAAGAQDTADLARSIQAEERETAEKVWRLISPWALTAFRKLAGAEQLTT